jgi:hypothetical protein
MEGASEIEFKNVVVQIGQDTFVAVPKDFGTQHEAHAYIITMGLNGYDKAEEDSKFWYFIRAWEISNPTNREPWTVKKFDASDRRNGFFPAIRFGAIKYFVELLEIEFAKQIAKFIHTLPKSNTHGVTLCHGGDMSTPLVKVCNYEGNYKIRGDE